MKKAIQITGAPAPLGPYSQAILSGNTLYVSGQIPLDPYTGTLITHSIEDATHQVLKNISALIQEAGMSMENIIKCSIFLKSMDDFVLVNEVYGTYFGSIPPARETIEVAKLPLDVQIEISCIAIKN
jgi:2-iminobutanoate/2-iminopropanoate deaminase